MSSLLQGLRFNFSGFRYLLARPRLWVYLIIPLFLNALLIIVLLSAYSAYAGPLFAKLAGTLGGLDIVEPQGFFSHIGDGLLWVARGLLKIVFFVLSIVLIFVFGFFISGFINSPFYENLCEKILILEGKRQDAPFTWEKFRKNLIYTLRTEAVKFLVFMTISLTLLVLSFIPVVGVVIGFLQILFTAWLIAFGLCTLPLSLQRTPARQVMRWGRQRKLMLIGFGLPSLIPLIGVMLMGLQVPGATLLFIDQSLEDAA